MTPAEFKAVRESYGKTQTEWARFIGLDGAWAERSIRRYEAGKAPIAGTVRRVVELLAEKRARTRQREKQDIDNRSGIGRISQ